MKSERHSFVHLLLRSTATRGGKNARAQAKAKPNRDAYQRAEMPACAVGQRTVIGGGAQLGTCFRHGGPARPRDRQFERVVPQTAALGRRMQHRCTQVLGLDAAVAAVECASA